MADGSITPGVVVSVDTPGLGAKIRYEDEVYALVGGEIRAGSFERNPGDSGSPGIVIESRVKELDAPDRYEGESVVVLLDDGMKDVKFPALGLEGTESTPAAFESVRGKEPAGKFSEYDTALKILQRAESVDGRPF